VAAMLTAAFGTSRRFVEAHRFGCYWGRATSPLEWCPQNFGRRRKSTFATQSDESRTRFAPVAELHLWTQGGPWPDSEHFRSSFTTCLLDCGRPCAANWARGPMFHQRRPEFITLLDGVDTVIE